MSWIICIILFIIALFLAELFRKTNREVKELELERTCKFEDYCNKRIDEVNRREEERREKLEREYKEKERNLQDKTRKFEDEAREFQDKRDKLSYEIDSLNSRLLGKQNLLRAEDEKIEEKIQMGSRIVESEVSKYKTEQIQKADKELADVLSAINKERLSYYDVYESSKKELVDELEEIKIQLEDFRKRRAAVNDAILREKSIQEKEDFYRIILTKDDIDDMKVLEGISPRMRNKNIIPKLIWDAILRRPVQEMIKRVTEGKDKCGIYKVTYTKTGEAYIGQSSSINARWANHAKTAIGLEAAASSTFHTRLTADGIENYTWEIIEEVPKEKLREREKYWIDFYDTKNYGLNQRVGG